jgi:hypothetical protein
MSFVPFPSDYSSADTIARIREALIANTYDSDDGEYDGTATPDIQSVSLPWWVWDDIFGALLRCSDDDSDALAHILYPESGPLNDIKHLIEGPSFVNMVTLNEMSRDTS